MQNSVLASELQREFLRSIRDSSSMGYNPARFLRMLQDHGPVITAVHLVMSQQEPEGFETLFISRRLDLSVEAIILQEPYRQLFVHEVLEKAEQKLKEIGYVMT